jgi:hypothetical protein
MPACLLGMVDSVDRGPGVTRHCNQRMFSCSLVSGGSSRLLCSVPPFGLSIFPGRTCVCGCLRDQRAACLSV